jgi:glutamine synthetase
VAARHHLLATFMPKPVFGINGSGMHTNQSLFSIRTGRNVFGDPHGENGLSTVARQFIAGQLAHARGMCAVLAPLVNSYKRLVPGYEAPVYISWGRVNRSALIRIPQVAPGRSETVRAELRCPDPSCNPYLAFAVMLRCGLDGIRRKLEPPAPTEENLYLLDAAQRRKSAIKSLPGSLSEALDEFEKDEVVRGALGPHIAERFLEAKRRECDEARLQVTPWEIDKYLTQY